MADHARLRPALRGSTSADRRPPRHAGDGAGRALVARLSRAIPGAALDGPRCAPAGRPQPRGPPRRPLDTGTHPELRSSTKGAPRPRRTRKPGTQQVTRPGGSMLVRMGGSKVVRAGTAARFHDEVEAVPLLGRDVQGPSVRPGRLEDLVLRLLHEYGQPAVFARVHLLRPVAVRGPPSAAATCTRASEVVKLMGPFVPRGSRRGSPRRRTPPRISRPGETCRSACARRGSPTRERPSRASGDARSRLPAACR